MFVFQHAFSILDKRLLYYRLTGERGFKALYEEFPKIKFKGNGHETSDLALLLQRYELWAHRLFPKMTFRDVLDRVEKLEKDKEVKVGCMHIILSNT